MAVIQSGASADLLTVDPTSKAGRATLYDAAGGTLAKADKLVSGVTPGTTSGVLAAGADGSTPRLVRVMSDGSIADGRPRVEFIDLIEGAAVNTNLWVQTLTTMTITQAAATGILFNAGSSVATTVGAAQIGQSSVFIPSRGKVIFRSRQRHTAHFANNLIELGLISTTVSATTTLQVQGASGFIWQKDGSGQYIPSIFVAGALTSGTPISNATFVAAIPATDYAIFEIEAEPNGAWFRIYTMAGTLVAEQRVNLSGATGDISVTHLFPFLRNYNSAGTGTAVQSFVADTAVFSLDLDKNIPWGHQLAAMGYGFWQSPTAFTQMANYVNVTAPTTRTVTNTTALEATLGGHCSWNNAGTSFAANEAAGGDLVIFGQQIPTPWKFICTGVRISTVNLGAANGAAAYTIEYSLAVNSNAVSLATAAPNAPRFIPLGFQSLIAAAAIGATFDKDIIHAFTTPVVVQPGRFIHVVARVIGASAATASQVIRTLALLEGYFE